MSDEQRRSVRVEIDGELGEVDTDEIEFSGPSPGGRGQVIALVAFLAFATIGLWMSARPDAGTDAARDDLVSPTTTSVPSAGPEAPSGDLVTALSRRLATDGAWLPLDLAGDRLVPHDGGWVGVAGTSLDSEFSPAHRVVRTVDGVTWSYTSSVGLPEGGRMIAIDRHDGELVSLHVDDAANRLSAHRSGDALVWAEVSSFLLDGLPVGASLRDGRWAVLLAPTIDSPSARIITSDIAGRGRPFQLEVSPSETVTSFVATADGLLLTIEQVEFTSSQPGDDVRTMRVAEWTPATGLVNVATLTASSAGARFVDAGAAGVHFADGRMLLTADADGVWQEVAIDAELPASTLEDPSVELVPAAGGIGFMASAAHDGDGRDVWLNGGGGEWVRFRPIGAVDDPHAVLVTHEFAVVAAIEDGRRAITRVPLDRAMVYAGMAEVVERPIGDGEWAPPVLAANADISGFVGLTVENGVLWWAPSADGVTFGPRQRTDLPFSFFPSQLQLVDDGWITAGTTATLHQAIFRSGDGLTWEQLELELPRDAIDIDIVEIDRRLGTNLVQGYLRFEGDARIEWVMLRWLDGFAPIEVPRWPCEGDTETCRVTSATLTRLGIVATTINDEGAALTRWSALSRWTQEYGWLDANPVGEGTITLQSSPVGPVDARLEFRDLAVDRRSDREPAGPGALPPAPRARASGSVRRRRRRRFGGALPHRRRLLDDRRQQLAPVTDLRRPPRAGAGHHRGRRPRVGVRRGRHARHPTRHAAPVIGQAEPARTERSERHATGADDRVLECGAAGQRRRGHRRRRRARLGLDLDRRGLRQ